MTAGAPLHGRVEDTRELQRVLALPTSGPCPVSQQELTEELGGDGMTLRVGQTLVLVDLYEWNGVLARLPVGEGKTLPGYLAPQLMGASRPLQLVPGELRFKTERDYEKLKQFWPDQPMITLQRCKQLARNKRGSDQALDHWPAGAMLLVSYEEVSIDPTLLLRAEPDLVVGDECHRLKNLSSGCTRHVRDWRRAHPDVPLLLMSGTITQRSLKDFAHMLEWTHGRLRMPLPALQHELTNWARAVDEKVEVRADPGCLKYFLPPKFRKPGARKPDLSDFRRAISNRIFSTPGCIRTKSKECNASLIIRVKRQRVSKNVATLIKRVQSDKRDWHGMELTPPEIWRHTQTLALEFHYEWEKPGPDEWMKRRASWKRQVREILENDWPGLTTEKHVASAVLRGEFPERRYRRWKEIEPTFKPKTKTVWHSTKVLEEIIAEAKKGNTDVWVWVLFQAVGKKLSELTGWDYFHSKGMCGKKFIEDHRSGPAIVSFRSNLIGKNLQHFNRNIYTTPITTGDGWEQSLGRTHRSGQQADEVDNTLFAGYTGKDFQQALSDAIFHRDMNDEESKLGLADVIE